MSTFTVDGPSLTGEATIEKGAVVEEAARQHAREVETEPLPVEVREQVRRFNELLLGGDGGGGGAPAGSGETAGEK